MFAALALFPRAAEAAGVVSPQVFTRGSFVYVVEQKQITFLSMDTRGAHTLYSAGDSLFDIVGIVRSGDIIWASNRMGAVIAVNMQTGTVEEFSRGNVGGGGYVDVDRRFVWVAAGDMLYRMDLTSREWVKIAVPGNGGSAVRGVMSFNEQVHVVTSDATHVLTTASDDWVTVPHRDFVLTAGDVRRVGDAVYFTQERAVLRYDPSKRLFAVAAVRERIGAASFGPDRVDVVAGGRVHSFNARNLSLEPAPAIPILRGAASISRDGDMLVCAAGIGLVSYSTPFNVSVAPYPDYVSVDDVVFVFSYSDHVMLYSRGGFVVYSPARKLWSRVRIRNRGAASRKGLYGWDEDGAHVTFSDKYVGTPSGTATIREQASADYADTSDLTLDPMMPLANVTLNLRTEDHDGRTLDLMVDNAVTTLPPQKGFYYKGIEGDILSRASFGVQGTGLEISNVSPQIITEGASAVFSGATAVDGRDRSLVTGTAGSGYILSQTEWRTVGYAADGRYYLRGVGENREVAANTVKLYVDGIPLPATDYVYEPLARSLSDPSLRGVVRLLRREKTNPTSAIQIAFAERAYPAEREVFEPLPKDHKGQYNFIEGAVSPREWLSARAGFLTVNREGSDLSQMVLAGIPVEWRGANGRSLLVYPEVAYDSRLGAQSAGVTAGASGGGAFGSYSGRWVGRDFVGLDKPAFNYQSLSDEHEINIGYDLRDNLRASVYQVHRRTEYNSLSNVELRTSYTGDALPDIEMAVGGLFTENNLGTEMRDRRHKESLTLRLSDLSARYLSGAKGIHSAGYDFSWTEYNNNSSEHGRVAYGMANFSPISALTFTGTAVYRLNPKGFNTRREMNPQISVDARDFPRGFDISSSYAVYVSEFADGVSHVGIGENISSYFYPGEYVEALKRLALYVYCAQETEHLLPTGAQPMGHVLFSDDLTISKRTVHEGGLLFFPTDNLLISTLNSRSWDRNTGEVTYTTNERAGLWLQGGSKLEASAGASKSPSRRYLYGDAQYEHRWAGGFMAGAGAFGSRLAERDSANVDVEAGPILSASIVKEYSGYIRSIENSHYLRVAAVRGDNMPAPNVGYAFYIRLKMPPDISIVAELGADLNGSKNGKVATGVYLHAGF
jgi:hypothetical protein